MTVFRNIFVFLILELLGCAHGSDSAKPNRYPPGLQKPAGVRWDAKANALAQLACQEQKTNLSAKDRIRYQVYEPYHRIFLFRAAPSGPPIERLNTFLTREARALQASHMGVFQSVEPQCLAIALMRRNLSNLTSLPLNLGAKSATPFRLRTDRPIQNPTLFIQHPSGRIDQKPLKPVEGSISFELRGADWPKGHYIVEVLGQVEANSPEILFWWRLTREARTPHPWPRLRFEELSQTDLARGMKIENMIVQLRGTALVHRLHVSPQLKEVARMRAEALAQLQGVGHNRPFKQTPDETLEENFTHPEVTRIVELQSQSASLKEAWDGIVESPAHVAPLISRKVTHMAAAAVKREDALGNPLVTVVVLLGNEPAAQIGAEALPMKLISRWNEYRFKKGWPLLERHPQLQARAQSVAEAMQAEGSTRSWAVENGLPDRVLEEISDLSQVTGTLIHTKNPEALDNLPWNEEKRWSQVGIGLVPTKHGNALYLCVLVGQTRY